MDWASVLTEHMVHHEHEAYLLLWPLNSPTCSPTEQNNAFNFFPQQVFARVLLYLKLYFAVKQWKPTACTNIQLSRQAETLLLTDLSSNQAHTTPPPQRFRFKSGLKSVQEDEIRKVIGRTTRMHEWITTCNHGWLTSEEVQARLLKASDRRHGTTKGADPKPTLRSWGLQGCSAPPWHRMCFPLNRL